MLKTIGGIISNKRDLLIPELALQRQASLCGISDFKGAGERQVLKKAVKALCVCLRQNPYRKEGNGMKRSAVKIRRKIWSLEGLLYLSF